MILSKMAELRYKTGDTKKSRNQYSTSKARRNQFIAETKWTFISINAYQNLQALMNTKEPFEISQ
jgi:hypothetical protein